MKGPDRAPSVLVTGGAGYIGRALTKDLVAVGYDVTVLDNLSTGSRAGLASGVRLIEGDVTDVGAVRRILRTYDVDLVVHLAARTQAMASFRTPELYMAQNLVATQTLIETVLQDGPRPIVLASTAAVYGRPSKAKVSETAFTSPTSPYGVSKLLAENALREASQRHGVPWLALRYFNVTGGGAMMGNGCANALFSTLEAVAAGRRPHLPVYGHDHPTPDGTCMRDYIHIDDLVLAHLSLIPKLLRREICGIANLGSGEGASVLEVVAAFERQLGRPLPQLWEPARVGEISSVVADISKLKGWLPDWRPKRSKLDSLVASTLGKGAGRKRRQPL